ncbi:MAG: 16S rRNA (adenine(1518)-N(6)/adenine(1519)-N(6))-dimethyltransferase RsmA [Clostridia bacterium]|nr:16S rRNA (adenine(1518)-N(6)/adenine(1519)-N(6))-dimethyltransferase RsmA [Clostridia bacterium]
MERLTDIGTIKTILSRHGFTFSKVLGQNFIVNPNICPRMADISGAGMGVGVIEVGPGIGVLTAELAKLADKVVAVELDSRLPQILSETLADFDNVKIINDDIMKIDLHKLIEEEFPNLEVVVCANLPYYITSPVIMRLLEERLPIKAVTVMVQKEAAQRICAPVGSRLSGAVTVAVNYYSEPSMKMKISAGSFMPPPKVDSAVITLKIRQEQPVKPDDEEFFFKVIRAAFAQRRKTAINSIANSLSIPKSRVESAFEQSGIAGNARAESLSMEQFSNISKYIKQKV